MRCIFCLQDRPPSTEHVFPDAVGGTFTIDRVCKPCNDHLGAQVDPLLSEHALVVLRRHQLGMKDRAGKAVSPWRGIFGRPVLGDDPGLRMRWVVDTATGMPNARVLHTPRTTERPDGSTEEWVAIDASGGSREIRTVITRERKRRGLPPLSEPEMEAQVAATFSNVRTIDKPSVTSEIVMDTVEYTRGLVKIAYELAWLWMGDGYLTDPRAAVLRHAALSGDMAGVLGSGFFGVGNPAFSPWTAESNVHMALGVASPDRKSMIVALRIFDVLSGAFQVTEDAGSYARASEGGFIANGPALANNRLSSFREEVGRLWRTGYRPS